jgi:adenylate cyclase
MNQSAWLETNSGDIVNVHGECGLGRARDNQLVINEQGVSRRHALIHIQAGREYWLVDLGSRNGTFVNGRRLTRPTRLRSNDRIRIGSCDVVFKVDSDASIITRDDSDATMTVAHTRVVECWLLIADVIDSTRLIRTEDPKGVSQMMGAWLSRCRDQIEGGGGTINKFLGDGFFAYWPENFSDVDAMVKVLDALRKMQEDAVPPFRLVLHRGGVTLGADLSPGEEELIGAEVSRVFRMEKLAGTLGLPRLASKAAREGLDGGNLEFQEAGEHELDGFVRRLAFYSW